MAKRTILLGLSITFMVLCSAAHAANISAARPTLDMVIAIDGHGLSPAQSAEIRATVASDIVARVVPGAPPITISIVVVTAETLADQDILSVATPAIPPTPINRCSGFDFTCIRAFRKAQEAAAQALTRACAQVRAAVAALAHLPIPTTGADDLPGALFFARSALAGAANPRLDVLAAFLPAPKTDTTLRLPRVDAVLIVACAAGKGTTPCLVNRARWIRAISAIGARSVQAGFLGEQIALIP